MGTVAFDAKFTGMKKPCEFIVYPIQKGASIERITIQSENRFGYIYLSSGDVSMSKPSRGANTITYALTEPKIVSRIPDDELKILRAAISGTGSKELVGDAHVLTDNSGALEIV